MGNITKKLQGVDEVQSVVSVAKQVLKQSSERIEYGGAEIFLVDRTSMSRLTALKSEAYRAALASGHLEGTFDPFMGTMKLVNPSRPARAYTLFMRKTPRIITDQKKVLDALEHEFAVWVNVRKKALKDTIDAGDFSEAEAERMRVHLEMKIKEERSKLEQVLENPDAWDMRIAGYDYAKEYPAISTSYPQGETPARETHHLSIRIPNVVWYEPEYGKRRRSDASIKRIMETYIKIGGTIYVMQKKQKTDNAGTKTKNTQEKTT